MGSNGSGKSTLLGIASGRLKPRRGAAFLGGIAMETLAPAALAEQVAALPQTERVAFDFSCLDFVLFARLHKRGFFAEASPQDIRCAEAALESMDVAHLADRPITGVSGGEFQLVRLARCVAQEAPLLVLDEPTAMLDPAHSLAVAQAALRIAESGKTVFLSTHDLGLAMSIAHRAYVLRGGDLVTSGPPGLALSMDILTAAFGVPFALSPVPRPTAGS